MMIPFRHPILTLAAGGIACSICFLRADDRPEAETRFLAAPKEAVLTLFRTEAEEISSAALPAGLQTLLLASAPWPGETKLPETLSGYRVDLNGDKKKEVFVETIMGGSGGAYYLVASKQKGQPWKIVLEALGIFHVLPAESEGAWCPVIGIYRGGDGYYEKTFYEVRNGKYNAVRSVAFEKGVVTESDSP